MKPTELIHPSNGEDLARLSSTLQRNLSGGLSIRKNSLGEIWDRLLITGPAPTWNVVGAAGQPAFQNNWAAYGAPYEVPRFTMGADSRVTIEGLEKKTTAIATSTMWALPVGYRPALDRIFRVAGDNGAGGDGQQRVDVLASGNVNFITAGAGGAGYLSLNQISFYADPSNCAPPDLKLATAQILRTKLKQVLGVQVLGVIPKVSTDYVGPVTAQWQRSREGIVITSFTGLQPGRQYYVSLYVIGDDKQ